MKFCPKCGSYSLTYDSYHERKICIWKDCAYVEKPKKKRVIITGSSTPNTLNIWYRKTITSSK